ncbi:hypothetical protein HPB50_008193 [Hyalomma asiaticum]|uniref:Uncharacterized protein n=1 Tax=Hyalomma asiaticum TaxID=266040 RepID=A0ACB7SFE5_HYAAI|nr:hypothetical protein HPB50_008193 [Hyalomma asiaticum]
MTAEGLHSALSGAFERAGVPYKRNLVGFAADGASVMMGSRHSVMALLKKEIPSLSVVCMCHSFHLCALYACSKLPRVVQDLVRDVYSYFSSSPKRIDTLTKFQAFLELKPHKLLHSAQTRWLSLLTAVDRFLEQYDALEMYFATAASTERLLASEKIHKGLQDPLKKLFLMFLSFVLPLFNLNKQMQSNDPQLHKLSKNAEACVRTFMDCYPKRSCTQGLDVAKVEFKNRECFVPLEDTYIGGQATAFLSSRQSSITAEQCQLFRLRCLDFYIESVDQMQKRVPFQESVPKHFELLDPAACMNGSAPSIASISKLVAGNALQDLDNEWRYLRNTEIPTVKDPSLQEFRATVFAQKHWG